MDSIEGGTEGKRSSAANRGTLERPWELWKKAALR